MATVTGTGASTNASTRAGAAEAVKNAVHHLGGKKPTVGWIFASPKHNLGEALAAAEETAPGAEFMGCSTSGEFTERGLTRGGISAMVLHSDELVHDLTTAAGLKSSYAQAAQRLCARFS